MAIMPGAQYVNAATSALMSRYDVVCIHTIVGYAPAHAAHFSTKANGAIIQSRDTKYKSAANLNGNHRVIAIENEDHGTAYGSWSGSNVPYFTEAQIESIAQICAWAYRTHGVPLVLCPDSKPTSRGIAYHRQGCDGNYSGFKYGGRVEGGELWSSAYGKVCPGDRRIDQLITRIIPRARQIAGLDHRQEEEAEVKPKLVRWQNGPEIFAVTPLGHWHLTTQAAVNNFAYQWGLPFDANNNAIVNVVAAIDWIGPNLTQLALDAEVAAANTTPPSA